MTVTEMLNLMTKAQQEGRLMLKDGVNGGKTEPIKSVSIRIDDDGQVFVIVHSTRVGDLSQLKDQ